MSFSMYDASAPVFINSLTNMSAWLDKAASEKSPDDLIKACLIEEMRPFPAQIQMAADSAKNAMARLTGTEAPAMPDTEASFAELQERCAKTISYIESFDPAALKDSAEREVVLKFPNGKGYRFTGAEYLTRFALPNFYFHVTMTYAILRAQGVTVGKMDYLQHLGPTEEM